jgi:hypothetical protein
VTERPNRYGKEIDRQIVEKILPQVTEWLGESESKTEDSPQKDMLEMLRLDHAGDGYTLAKWLERNCGWSADSALVEILDDVPHERIKLHTDAVMDWVKANDVKPTLELGTRVTFQLNGWKEVQGVIVGLYPETAQYTVAVDGSKYLVEYEQCEEVQG